MLRKSDFIWILAAPVYQIIGTIRHEGAHAIMATLEGADVVRFVFWPTFPEGRGIRWGFVRYFGETTWVTTAAPYFLDLLTCVVFFLCCAFIPRLPRWMWLNLVVIGIVSPLVNSVFNYTRGSDGSILLQKLPVSVVHLYFVLTILLYAICLVAVFRYRHKTKLQRVKSRTI